MRLLSLVIEGVLGIPPASPVVIRPFGDITVFIGPNNAGKSTAIKALHAIVHSLKDGAIPNMGVDASWRHQRADILHTPIGGWFWQEGRGQITVKLRAKFDDKEAIVTFEIQRHADKQCLLTIVPESLSQPGKPLIEFDDRGAMRPHHRSVAQAAEKERFFSELEYFRGFLQAISAKSFFFDAIRSMERPSDGVGEDGAKLLHDLGEESHSREKASQYERFRAMLISQLNDLFVPCGISRVRSVELKQGHSSSKPQLVFFFDSAPHIPVDVTNMGTGISQLVILLALLIRNSDSPGLVFIEEPECNLHPALLKRLLHVLKTYKRFQFVITSHSSSVLNSLDESDAVYHFKQAPTTGACEAVQCKGIIEKHGLLDSLGVSGGDLLQANCTVWVEGPTDRLYIREWLNCHAESEGIDLQEGSDYAFAFTGGGCLSHCGFDADDQDAADKLVSLIEVSRFSAVVMDSDVNREQQPPPELTLVKRRIIEATAVDQIHRHAVVTDGRDIENDLPTDLLRAGIERLLQLPAGSMAEWLPSNDRGFEKEAADYLEEKGLLPTGAWKLGKKVLIAGGVFDAARESKIPFGMPSYIPKLAKFILSSRALH